MSAAEKRVETPEKQNVYTNDPLYFKSFVNNYVRVETKVGLKLQGFVYSIDPVSESVILLTENDEKIGMDIVLGHSVSGISKIPMPPECSRPTIPDDALFNVEERLSEEETRERRGKLKAWLCENHFPVVEDGNMLVMENVIVIESPYGLNQCLSSNDIVLQRVHKLLMKMPWVKSP